MLYQIFSLHLWSWTSLSFFILVAFSLGVLLLGLTFILAFENKIDYEKSSVYECGFNPFADSRYRFDVKFYLVSILFVIFDVEILYFFPFALSLHHLPWSSVLLFLLFFLVLFLGIIYEVSRSVLDFEEK